MNTGIFSGQPVLGKCTYGKGDPEMNSLKIILEKAGRRPS
jgi:hypothetical protein